MHIQANMSFVVVKEGSVNSQGGKKIMPGGRLRTLTPVNQREGEDHIFVRYTSTGAPDEINDGAKFWLKVHGMQGYVKPS